MHKNKDWLHEQFIQKNRSADDIGKECGVTNVTIRFWARRFGLERRRYGAKKLNDRYFENINTKQKAYWLGFIAADGCVQDKKGKRLLSICLSSKDEDHLLVFRDAIKSQHSIYRCHRQTPFGDYRSSQLDLASTRLVIDLKKWGIVPRKTFILKSPRLLPRQFRSHWVRGYFDGDGSVGIYPKDSKKARLVGCILGTKKVLQFIKTQCPFFQSILPDANIWRMGFGGNRNAQMLYDYLYNDADDVCLMRKKRVFEKLLEEV